MNSKKILIQLQHLYIVNVNYTKAVQVMCFFVLGSSCKEAAGFSLSLHHSLPYLLTNALTFEQQAEVSLGSVGGSTTGLRRDSLRSVLSEVVDLPSGS